MSRLTKFDRLKPREEVELSTDPELVGLSYPESSYGVDTSHPPYRQEGIPNVQAAGAYGMAPNTAHEIYKKNPDIQEKYPHIEDFMSDWKANHSQISQLIEDDPELSSDLAKKNFEMLKVKFQGNPEKAALGHFRGVTGAKRALREGLEPEEIQYIKKFNIGREKISPKKSSDKQEAFKQLKQILKLK